MELLDKSTYGPDSLLKPESVYETRKDKRWDEAKLEEWEFKRNGSRDWEGRLNEAGSESHFDEPY
jgi:hypothetical protein